MKTINRIDPISVGKIAGLIQAIFGFIFGAIISLFSTLFAFIPQSTSSMPILGIGFGVAAIIFLPIFYGAIGFIFGIISAALYNFIAKKVGGIKIDIT